MSETFDLLIRGGLAATPSGIAEADIGVRGGRIASIGALGSATAAETIDAGGAARPSRRHRHPGPFPRARQRAQGRPRDRQPRGGARRGDGGVRDAQHQSADHDARRHRGQARARQEPHALRPRVLCRRDAGQCRCARRAGAHPRRVWREGVPRLVDGHAPAQPSGRHPHGAQERHAPRRRPFRGRGPADRAQGSARDGRSALASFVARRGDGARLDRARAAVGARGRTAAACAACDDRGGASAARPPRAISPPSRRRRSISRSPRRNVTSGSAPMRR